MTIEKLLGKSADELERMTPQEVDEYFKPWLTITRPELAPKPEKRAARTVTSKLSDTQRDLALQGLASFGINLDDIL